MPRATVSLEPEEYELQTVEGGKITLKRMTYGQKLERNQIAMDMTMESGGKGRGTKASVDIMQARTTLYEYKACIVDHNLTDDDDQLLDFTKPTILGKLDPRVGDEISDLIGKQNNYDEDDDLGN